MRITIGIAVVMAVSSLTWGQSQRQNQRQQQNVNNTTENSHNNTASGGASTADATGGSASNGSVSETSNYERQTATAVGTTTFHTSPCVKSWGGGAQAPIAGLSLGGGKVDRGCDVRETAEEFRNAGSMVAFCKMMITEPNAEKAGVTFEDCMAVAGPKVAQEVPALPATSVLTPQIIVPAPVVTINIPPAPTMPIPEPRKPVAARSVKKVARTCPVKGSSPITIGSAVMPTSVTPNGVVTGSAR